MSKRKKPMSGLPSIESIKPGMEVKLSVDETIKSFTETAPIEPDCTILSVSVPSFEWQSGYARRKLDVALSSDQAAVLKSMQLGLEKQEAQLKNGRYVANPVDAIRWVLENVKPEI
jgi:hypothetical protein